MKAHTISADLGIEMHIREWHILPSLNITFYSSTLICLQFLCFSLWIDFHKFGQHD